MKALFIAAALSMLVFFPAFGEQISANGLEKAKSRPFPNQLGYNGRRYPLRAGLEHVFRPDKHHANSRLHLTNGEFYSTQVWLSGNLNLIWRARRASAWLYVDMYSPGRKRFRGGKFVYVPNRTNENSNSLKNKFFFKKGKIAIDTNRNGKLDKGEFLKVTGGMIGVKRLGTRRYRFDFYFNLENGTRAAGSYTGRFPKV